jgi:hypothetical protein
MWVAVGEGTNKIAYSSDGITWTGVGQTIFNFGRGVASNPRIGPVIVDSQIVLNKNGISSTQQLDVVSNNYYNDSFTNFTVSIASSNAK